MRRNVSACLSQTIKFDTMSDLNPEKELELYCKKLDTRKTKYMIEEKKKDEDGCLIVKIKRQYNEYKTDGYMK